MFPGALAAQTPQDVVWVQIEARPTYAQAVERVESYSQDLENVKGFSIAGGWFAIAIGPFTQQDAEDVLRRYRLQGLIPSDSYIALSTGYSQQYWPPGEDLLALGSLSTITAPAPLAPDRSEDQLATTPTVENAEPDGETPAEARRGERALTAEERRDLQRALQWAGHYNATIDGAFGRGTRDAMASWQGANGFEPTGILTSRQRTTLTRQYNAVLEGLDMEIVRDIDAGIEMRMPTAMIAFEKYDPPFAHYASRGDFAARVLLISQSGDLTRLESLYEILQTLRIVPLDGPRNLSRNSFSIVGNGQDFVSETQVTLSDGEIKGFTLIWPQGDEQRRARVLQEMRESFVRRSGTLDGVSDLAEDRRADLIAGLEVRRPIFSLSGFYVDGSGTVVTSSEAVKNCTRITLDDTYDATLNSLDATGGIAVLRPTETLAPPAVARISSAPPRLQSEVAVAGYSFEGQLNAPSITFGTLADLKGLSGEPDVSRLSLPALPGDVGGPVLDERGNVFGLLLPQPQGNRRLPQEVRFALAGEAFSAALARAGIQAQPGEQTASLSPEDIASRGVEMTVLVSCWE
ncbi:MAG: serine protease [Roseobacter sp.]